MSKEIKFEKGKWYKVDFGFTRYFKVSHFDEINVYSNEHFDDNNEYNLFVKEWKTRVEWLVERCTEVDILEIQDYLPADHPDRIVGLPEEYIVECTKYEEFAANVAKYYYKDSNMVLSWKYVICSKDLDGQDSRSRADSENSERYKEFKHLPVFTYEQWLKLKDMNKEFKVPERWCIKTDKYSEEIVQEYRDWETDRKSTRLNSSHSAKSRMPSSA